MSLSLVLIVGVLGVFGASVTSLVLVDILLLGFLALFYKWRTGEVKEKESGLQHLDGILNVISDAVLALDNDFRFTYCNRHGERLLNASFIQLKGCVLWECFPEAVDTPAYALFQQVMHQHKAGEVQFYYPLLKRHLHVRAYPADEGITVYFTDETERIQQEEILRHQQKIQAVGELTGGVAHDFNNALQVISGMAEILEDRLQNDSVALGHLAILKQASDRSAALTQQLLAFSRRQTLMPETLDLNQHLYKMAPLLRSTLGETVRLAIRGASQLAWVNIDAHQFDNALLNLAINARDAMPQGGCFSIRVTHTCIETAEAETYDLIPGDFVEVSIEDTGGGITEDIVTQIFEPFFTTKAPGVGTGLGLSAVYGFVRQSHGHILAYSEPGQGTTFRLYLPASAAPELCA
ncbi:nitrogen regulation protein NR(II) [Vreelandella aquamarina]|uniref:two-component system sensor histidine kinase NtrB n=1 Tax=Vreelandella aquamarina TaxID=77097 RepID=UPI00384EB526